ncbi:hypothetical protein [Aureispira anguillae]|uniref:Uncharacterized protein n=1 Tax=Aureispira anguillae TaxID=2864201 RepID=A0A915YFS1_9BACT|nr:hypothetical protein [Aureispira anguillae]BDS12196.1 hypothetical protein AsAng_0029110 [Aureispira anguillae]
MKCSLSFILIILCAFCSCIQAQNVGIGTPEPKHKLVVEGDRINLQNKEQTKFFYARTDGDEIDITTVGSHFWITAEEDKHIILNPNNSSSGNVGVGTYNPTEKLHIDGGLRVQSLEGEGNRIIYASPSGILSSSQVDISALERSNQALKEKVEEQAQLIQDLIQRIEQLEQP